MLDINWSFQESVQIGVSLLIIILKNWAKHPYQLEECKLLHSFVELTVSAGADNLLNPISDDKSLFDSNTH